MVWMYNTQIYPNLNSVVALCLPYLKRLIYLCSSPAPLAGLVEVNMPYLFLFFISTTSSILNSIATITSEHVISNIWKDLPDSRYLMITRLVGEYYYRNY